VIGSYIVVLNGPSSAGKSTLANALRDRLGLNAAAVSLDQFFPMVSPLARHDWSLFSTLFDATLVTALAFADRGWTAIVDTVFERPESLQRLRDIFGTRRYSLIAVTCPLAVLEAREQARSNRRMGLARDQHKRVFQAATYDLDIDTHMLSVAECIDKIAVVVETHTTGSDQALPRR
jgi:chloramphenicol 3-O phosphotransferase